MSSAPVHPTIPDEFPASPPCRIQLTRSRYRNSPLWPGRSMSRCETLRRKLDRKGEKAEKGLLRGVRFHPPRDPHGRAAGIRVNSSGNSNGARGDDSRSWPVGAKGDERVCGPFERGILRRYTFPISKCQMMAQSTRPFAPWRGCRLIPAGDEVGHQHGLRNRGQSRKSRHESGHVNQTTPPQKTDSGRRSNRNPQTTQHDDAVGALLDHISLIHRRPNLAPS